MTGPKALSKPGWIVQLIYEELNSPQRDHAAEK
jgi:hypothetical protein